MQRCRAKALAWFRARASGWEGSLYWLLKAMAGLLWILNHRARKTGPPDHIRKSSPLESQGLHRTEEPMTIFDSSCKVNHGDYTQVDCELVFRTLTS